jgi:O-antigen/teichoic acid export membrane protein
MILSPFLSAMTANATGLGLGFITHLILVSIMNVESYGLFNFIFSICVLISLISGLGFNTSAQRIIPILEVNNKEKIYHFISFCVKRTFLISSILGLICFIALYLFYHDETEKKFLVYLAGFFLSICLSLSRLQVGILKAFKKGVLAICYETVFREFLLILVICTCIIIGYKLALATHILWAYGLIIFTLCIFSNIKANSLNPIAKENPLTQSDIKNWMKISVPMMLIVATQMVMHKSDIIMLGFILDMNEVGTYSFASKIAQATSIVFIAATTIFSPRAANLFEQGKIKDLRSLYKKTQIFMGLGTACVCIILYIIYPYLLNFLNVSYSDSIIAFYILIIGSLMNAAWGPSAFLMIMTRYEIFFMWITFFMVILNIILNLLLIPYIGIIGAAFSTVITVNLRNIIGYIVFLFSKDLRPKSNEN